MVRCKLTRTITKPPRHLLQLLRQTGVLFYKNKKIKQLSLSSFIITGENNTKGQSFRYYKNSPFSLSCHHCDILLFFLCLPYECAKNTKEKGKLAKNSFHLYHGNCLLFVTKKTLPNTILSDLD